MRGAGSPSSITVTPDNGAGSPSSISAGLGDLGAGSPTNNQPELLGILVTPDGLDYGDFGGDIVQLRGAWPTVGPYRCRLTNDGGVTYLPSIAGCYSARVAKGSLCETDAGKRVLTFSLPPLEYGAYDLEVAYGVGYGTSTTITGAITVVPRDRAIETWGMRRTFPIWVATGGRTSQGTPIDAVHPTKVPVQGNIESLTRAFGMAMSESFGRPSTRLRSPYSIAVGNCFVESTLGFPESGVIMMGKTRYSYSSKTATGFAGLVQLGISDLQDKPIFTEIVLDAHAILTT